MHISSKIFNFKKFVSSLDLSAFVKDNTILPCNCKDSPYKARDSIKSGITDCVSTWCAKHRMNKNVLFAWQTEVLGMVDERIEKLKMEKEQKETQEVFKNPSSKNAFKIYYLSL